MAAVDLQHVEAVTGDGSERMAIGFFGWRPLLTTLRPYNAVGSVQLSGEKATAT